MEPTSQEIAARKRHNAKQRAYRVTGTGERFVVEAVEPGCKYWVRRGATRVTVWADSCDNAMTSYLRNN